jgi:hypothetical protein
MSATHAQRATSPSTWPGRQVNWITSTMAKRHSSSVSRKTAMVEGCSGAVQP